MPILAPINKIIECSTVDGPGTRTSIFVQRCNIHCLYCHNPETQNLCCNCGICISSCPNHALSFNKSGKVIYDESRCLNCDTCISICPNKASPKIRYLSAEQVYFQVKKNVPFIRGITVSGGECSLYPEFLVELFKLCRKERLTCLLDSNGMIDFSLYPELMNLTDGVMLDIKSWDRAIYQKLTGYDNDIVKKNLSYLDSIDKIEELRIVVLPDFVDYYACIDGIARTIQQENISKTKLKLNKFRRYGVKGVLKNTSSPNDALMNELRKYAETKGFKKIETRSKEP